MSPHWSRRALLASVGTAALAGCVEGGNSARETPPASRSTAAPPSFPAGEPDPPDALASAWPTPGAEPGRSNHLAGAAGPTDPVAPLWETPLPAAVTDPVVADGTLFVGAGETLHALDARTGDRRWRQSLAATAGRPWVVGDAAYVPTSGGVVALSTADGGVRWRTELPSKVDGGFLAASHGAYALTDADGPTAVALDRADGSEQWRTDIADPWTAHLFASDDAVFVSSGGAGVTPWQLAADTGDVLGDAPVPVTDSPDPRFYRDGTVYSRDALPAAVDARPAAGEGGHDWRERLSVTGLGPLSGGPDRLYAVTRGDSVEPRGDEPDDDPGLYALGLTDGVRAWSVTDVDADTAGRPAATDGTVLVPTADALRCFDPTDGSRRWAVPGDDVGEAVLAVDDVVYTSRDDAVRAFRPP